MQSQAGRKLRLSERVYILEVLRGLGVTARHFIENILFRKSIATFQYPEEKVPFPPTFRGEHRLMFREDGSIRCTACMLCATACPSECIYIEAKESPDPKIEKCPVRYEIDMLKCVFCGFCVEACPCDAIRMDTGKFPLPETGRQSFVKDINYLTNNHPSDKSKISSAIY